jgi:type IV secretion system protein VirB8
MRLMQRTTPSSPLNLYSPTTMVSTTVKSVSLLSPTTALVRFDTVRRDGGAAIGEQRPWAAVIAFRYSDEPMRTGDRFLDPLGFQVTRYRRDAETLTAAPTASAIAAPGVGAP